MRIVVVCDVLGEENNGTTVAAMNLIRSLRAKGHEVRVVCPDRARQGQEGYYIIPTVSFGPLNGYVRKNGVTIAKPNRATLEKALDGADAVHLLVPFFASHMAAKLAMERGIPVTAGFHCQAENFSNHIFLMNAKRFNRGVYRFFDRFVYRYVDCIHYPTQFIRDTYETAVGHPTNGRVISNGVNAAFRPAPAQKPKEFGDCFVILFTGRFSKEKSHKVLIDGAAQSKYADRIQLVFAGSGPQEKTIREYAAKRLKNPPVMRFFTRTELVNLINSADLYVHPAEIEIEAISCLEAIACGLVPVIADSPRSATRFFALTEENLFHFNDPAALAERIDYWLVDPARRNACRARYLGYAQKFEQGHCMEEMERMILETAEEKHERA
ncbi:MAG: glycosyltransferase [Faecousia sp.]